MQQLTKLLIILVTIRSSCAKNAKDGILKMIKDEDKDFITALIEETIDGLNDLKSAIESDDKIKFTQAIFKVSALRQAAGKWLNE
jgi:hypothetical protein